MGCYTGIVVVVTLPQDVQFREKQQIISNSSKYI